MSICLTDISALLLQMKKLQKLLKTQNSEKFFCFSAFLWQLLQLLKLNLTCKYNIYIYMNIYICVYYMCDMLAELYDTLFRGI